MDRKKVNRFHWFLDDLNTIPKNGLKVFSAFSGVGGSCLGYKKAGFDVVGCNDIDPRMMDVYKKNLHPKYAFLCSIKDLLEKDLPKCFYDLDVLDGSPPCSTFSDAQGKVKKNWGKLKKFREGQSEQILSNLFFDFINLAEKLKPKVVIAENVSGLIRGDTKAFAKSIVKHLKGIGYSVQLFLTTGSDCGLPQNRSRVFFVCRKKDLNWPELKFCPNERHISVKEAFQGLESQVMEEEVWLKNNPKMNFLWEKSRQGHHFGHATLKHFGERYLFTTLKNYWSKPSFTITATNNLFHPLVFRKHTTTELKILCDFPNDFSFETEKNPNFSYRFSVYGLGMSVPPKMIECLSKEIAKQWFSL